MAEAQRHLIHSEHARARIIHAVQDAPIGYVVEINEPPKSREQESKYHAMFSDIAMACEYLGGKMSPDDWKRVLVDAFAKYKRSIGEPLRHDGRIVPSLDGQGVVQLGVQTRKLLKAEAGELIEFLYAFGAERDVKWSEPDTWADYQRWAQERAA